MTRRDPVRADGSRPLPVPDEDTLRRFCRGEGDEERLCLHCRNPFAPGRDHAAYCRPKCKQAAAHARHREYHKLFMRALRARRRTA